MGQRLLSPDALLSVDCDRSGNWSNYSPLQVSKPMSWRIAFMKSTIQRVLFAVALATLGAGAVGTASAQTTSSAPGAAPQHHFRGHHHHFRGPLVGPLLKATKHLGLTAQQQSVIQDYLKAAHQPHQAGAQAQGPGITGLADPGNQN